MACPTILKQDNRGPPLFFPEGKLRFAVGETGVEGEAVYQGLSSQVMLLTSSENADVRTPRSGRCESVYTPFDSPFSSAEQPHLGSINFLAEKKNRLFRNRSLFDVIGDRSFCIKNINETFDAVIFINSRTTDHKEIPNLNLISRYFYVIEWHLNEIVQQPN